MTLVTATLASAFDALAGVVRRQVGIVNAWRQARSDYSALCGLDERTLKDIGLTRSDLRDASAAGFFDDPTVIVAARAAERGPRRVVPVSTRTLTGPSIVPDVAAATLRPAHCA